MSVNVSIKSDLFERPWNQISKPLDQCKFTMTRIENNGQPYPVNLKGEKLSIELKTLNFQDTRYQWVLYQDIYFDGYSLVLDEHGQIVKINGDNFYIVCGHHKDCITKKGTQYYFSNQFMADWLCLDKPTIWLSPDKYSIFWAGLSQEPILGGSDTNRIISSFQQMIPITTAVSEDDSDPPLKVLPANAVTVINKWFPSKEIA